MLTQLHQEAQHKEGNHDRDLTGQGFQKVYLCSQSRIAFSYNCSFKANYSCTAWGHTKTNGSYHQDIKLSLAFVGSKVQQYDLSQDGEPIEDDQNKLNFGMAKGKQVVEQQNTHTAHKWKHQRDEGTLLCEP